MAILNTITNDPLLMVGVVVLALAVSGVLALMALRKRYSKSNQNTQADFEPKELNGIIGSEVENMVKNSSNSESCSIGIRHGWDVKGVVERRLNYNSSLNDFLSKDLDGNDLEIEIPDKNELKKAKEKGQISNKVYKLLTEFDKEPIYVMLIREKGFLNGVKFDVLKSIGQEDEMLDIKIVPERLVEDNGTYLTLEDNVNFVDFAGMDLAKEASVFNFIEEIGFKKRYEQALRDQQNYHEQINLFNSGFSQFIQKEKAKANAEASKYEGKTTGMVEED